LPNDTGAADALGCWTTLEAVEEEVIELSVVVLSVIGVCVASFVAMLMAEEAAELAATGA